MTVYVDADTLVETYPTIVAGVAEDVLEGLCVAASKLVEYYTLVPSPDTTVLAEAATCQVLAWIQTGDLQEYGLPAGATLKLGAENLVVANSIADSTKRVLALAGYTTPFGA